MEKRMLGRTGIEVSRLCFGTLPMGPLQKALEIGAGADLLRRALDLGINFYDTAEAYGTHAHLAAGLAGRARETIVSTKSAAADYAGMRKSVEKALRELERESLDIMLLHAARVAAPFRERAGALECLVSCRERGLVRAIGISTHIVGVVEEAAQREEIDIIHPLVNLSGMGIMGGTGPEMAAAIAGAANRGKGVFGMKALAGGNLSGNAPRALSFALGLDGVHSFAVGMVSEAELAANALFFSGSEEEAAGLMSDLPRNTRKLVILRGLCRGCGACLEECPAGALALEDGKAQVSRDRCILCGYCGPVCPEFAIRLA